MTKLRIYLFGPFEIFRNGQPLTNQDWRSQQTRAIGKILISQPGQVVSSDQIIDILWSDDPPETARKRLHVRISQLRTALGDDKTMLLTVDGGYIFSPRDNCWLDTIAFQKALAEGQNLVGTGQLRESIIFFEQARELYRGEFLAEDLYTNWTFPTREFYRERFLSLLMELSECYAQQGRYRLAIARCQEALNKDPLRETIYMRLMLYHYYAGERSQSLRTYERCCKVLVDELGVDPLVSTTKVAEQIRVGTLWASSDAPRYPPPIYEGRLFEVPYVLSETPLVGREREYAWLVEQWKNPETHLILLDGVAGIGKTRLAEAFVGYIAAEGAQVLRARIAPGQYSPYAPLVTALNPLLKSENLLKLSPARLSALSLVFPEILHLNLDLPQMMELPALAERERLYDAVTALVAASVIQPTLLFVDDAHRMGQISSEILIRLSQSLKIFLSYRSEEIFPEHPIHTVFQNQETGPAILQLEPLRPKAVASLIQKLAQNNLADLNDEIIRQTAGNPLYLVTLLQYMFDEGQLYVDNGGRWGVVSSDVTSLPPTIRETIEARLLSLDRSQRRVFDLSAVIGGEFDFDLLKAASQQNDESLLKTLDRLIDLALIVEPRRSGQREFAISHDRYIEVAYDVLPKVRQKHLHHQVAKAIEEIYADHLSVYYPSLADHFGKAEILERERFYAVLAGEQAAAQFENIAALKYLSRALELIDDDIQGRFSLLLTREKVYDLLGDRHNQKADLDELDLLFDKLPQPQQAEILYRRAAYEWILGNDDATHTNLEKSISLSQSCGATNIEAASFLLLGRGEFDQTKARKYLEKARSLAQQAALRPLEGDIVRSLGNACFWQNNYAESQTYFENALNIHREVGDLRGELSAFNNLGFLYQHLGQPGKAIRVYEQGQEICAQIGDRLAEGVLLTNLGGLLAEFGKYEAAQTRLHQACEIREAIQNDEGVGSLLPLLGDLLRRQGEFGQAKEQLERSLEINIRLEHPQQICLSLDALSQFYCELGDYGTAFDYFEKALASLDDEQNPNRVRALANGCLLHHLMGDNVAAFRIGEKALTLSQELRQIRAAVVTNLGHTLVGIGKNDEAQEKYLQALELRDELRQPHLGVEPQVGLAHLALAQGANQQALAQIESILPRLESEPLIGPDLSSWVYLTCYQVLTACDDARAEGILETVYNFIQQRSATIEDDTLRQSYLRNVISNQQILQLYNKQ